MSGVRPVLPSRPMTRDGARWAGDLQASGFRGALQPDEPLAPLTTWRLGGPAELLATPASVDDVACAVRYAEATGVPWRILGNGSNLLIRDHGVPGIVLRLRRALDGVEVDGETVRVGAGALFPAVAHVAVQASLAGIEFGAGIPGTLGGAIVMNAGWHEFEIGNVVESVTWIDERAEVHVDGRAACAFGYRRSAFRGARRVVLETMLALRGEDPERIRERLEAYAARRKETQPTHLPSCGSVFLKPPGDFAGRLIEAAGLKGLRIGGVEVSRKHANFFVHVGGGTAADALALVERVEDEVATRFGVRLEREFELW